MAKRHFELVEIEAGEQLEKQFTPRAFLQNYQTALLLSLLEKDLLTQWQFDRCIEELQKQAMQSEKVQHP
ncbi:MAG: hypothetical protein A4E55_02366 [Pelotomaculum sp. PtaU1.Bin035]|nr:MAG: hypothetical protein A4E55_02366 [Pelotomaculum sp. PtaU1.Bin035]